MRKSMLALLLVLTLVLTSNINVFGATSGTVIKEVESYKDSKTGLELSYPEDWSIKISYAITFSSDGTVMKGRKVVLSNLNGDYKVEITQLRTASLESGPRFIIKTPTCLYYVSSIQTLTAIDLSEELYNITALDEKVLQDLIDANGIIGSITINSGK